MANSNFKLVTKMDKNIGAVFLVFPNGESKDIAWIRFPNDKQMGDNLDVLNTIVPIIRKRIRKSL